MPAAKDSGQREVAARIVASASQADREKLLAWAVELVEIRNQHAPLFDKGRAAVTATLRDGVIWSVAKTIGIELRTHGWDNRGIKWKTGFVAAIVTAVATGGQGAGIAALGGAIGVPLWMVFGAGGSFLAMLYEELVHKGRAHRAEADPSQQRASDNREVVDVEARMVSAAPKPDSAQQKRGVCPGDTLQCRDCGHKREVLQSWLDTLARRYTPTSASRLTRLDAAVVRRLRCSECRSKALDLIIKPEAVGDDAGHYKICGACGGDGGFEGRCFKCFGSGFESNSVPPS